MPAWVRNDEAVDGALGGAHGEPDGAAAVVGQVQPRKEGAEAGGGRNAGTGGGDATWSTGADEGKRNDGRADVRLRPHTLLPKKVLLLRLPHRGR